MACDGHRPTGRKLEPHQQTRLRLLRIGLERTRFVVHMRDANVLRKRQFSHGQRSHAERSQRRGAHDTLDEIFDRHRLVPKFNVG